jgi:hypothetical protein
MSRAAAVLALSLAALVAVAPASASFLDAIVGEINGKAITASDIALARALGLFALSPSTSPIDADAVERFTDVLLALEEAERLGLEPSVEEVEGGWGAAAARVGGIEPLRAWLEQAAVDPAWPRRLVAADLRWHRFLELRFRAFVFVTEAEVDAELEPGRQSPAARARVRADLVERAVRRSLADWLAEARGRATVRSLLAPGEQIPVPFPMPSADARTSRDPRPWPPSRGRPA